MKCAYTHLSLLHSPSLTTEKAPAISVGLILCAFEIYSLKGGRMGRSDKVSLWCVTLLINTKFHLFHFRISYC